ncbi:protein jag [Acidipropionibacterium jensenii]|uniref:Jag family protein n=1 Tax=Acidipropionibacterium jensenii TaxID=1749 RepID=UPI003B8A71A2
MVETAEAAEPAGDVAGEAEESGTDDTEGAQAAADEASEETESEAGDAGAQGAQAAKAKDAEDSEEGEEGDVDPLDEEGDIAADYLEELLDIADLDGDIDTYVEAERAHVSIVTDSQTLVGKDGKVLEALQELSRLAVMTEAGHRSRLMLDIAGYREVRRKELLILATEAIASVKESGEPEHLAPMNPFERKIIHDAVAAAGLSSESEGVEPRRHVVISA